MPSRRAVLGSSGVILFSGLPGCPSGTDSLSAELLQLKAISVKWRYEGRSYRDQILQLLFDGERGVTGRVASEYSEVVSSPDDVAASEAVHAELRSDFEEVDYALGFCGSDFGTDDEFGCRNETTSREDFNAVQFGDRAEVKLADNRFRVLDVQEENVQNWDTDISEFEWTESHEHPKDM